MSMRNGVGLANSNSFVESACGWPTMLAVMMLPLSTMEIDYRLLGNRCGYFAMKFIYT